MTALQEPSGVWPADDEETAYQGGWVYELVVELKRSMPAGALLGLDLAAD